MCVCVCVCVCVRARAHTGGYERLCSFLPQLLSITNPLPPSFKIAGLQKVKVTAQTVKVQSDSDRGPVHGALCLDYTKLRPHKISRCVAAKFPSFVLVQDMARDSLCATNLCCSMKTFYRLIARKQMKIDFFFFFDRSPIGVSLAPF